MMSSECIRSLAHAKPKLTSSCHASAAVSRGPITFRPARKRQRGRPLQRAYTQEAVAAIRSAQQEACRSGSMFVAPPHLLLGLLDQPECDGSKLVVAAGLTSSAAHGGLLDPEAMPLSSSMGAGDLHWAPDARAALNAAAAAAQEAGQAAAGTTHLLLGVVTCGNASVNKVLGKAGIEVAAFAEQVREAVSSCTENVAQPPASAEDQAAALVQQYQQYVAKHGTAPPPGQAMGATVDRVITMTPEDDDIYN